MTTPLYNSQGTWSATVQYDYLDSVLYSKHTYICTASSGSINQNPSTTGQVWVQMPQIVQEDQYYLRSREDLLQYEDARYQSLINAMANFYTMRNDQSIWGSFLRAVAIELARIEYMYSYDVVSKNPRYLTPPDIKRQYANPLFVTGNFQQASQFDSGDFGASFGQWTANTGIILRFAILDSNGNIQIATTAGATGVSEPAWALLAGETTTDGEVVWKNAGLPPTTLAYPIGYREMLVDLLLAYREGATPKSIQDVIYAYTGKNIIVEELYKKIADGFYDQSDRNAVKVSVNVGGTDPLTDVGSLTELQQITNSLYGAIDLAKPAHVGLEFTTVFGADENIDCFISPTYLTQYQLNTLSANQKQYYNLIAYVLVQPTIAGWVAETSVLVGSAIQDSNGNIQLCTVSGVTGAAKPTWNATLQGATNETSTLSPPQPVSWVNIGTPQITITAYAALSTSQKLVYQGYYQNLNCVGSGINDTLRIIIQLYEEPPFDPMLYQAPIEILTNPTTTLASYGRRLLSPISATNWLALQAIPQVWNSGTTYNKGTLVRGLTATSSGGFSSGTWTPGGWQLYRALKKNTNQAVTNASYWVTLPSPSIYQAYYKSSNGQYVIGFQPWSTSTQVYVGQYMIDNGGNLQIAAIVNSPSSPPTPGVGSSSSVVNVSTSTSSVQISNNVLTLKLRGTGTVGMGLVAGTSLLMLLDFSYATFLNDLILPVVSFTSTSVSMAYVHDNYTSALQNESNATIRIGFSTSPSVPTYDGEIVWQYLGINGLTNPSKWIQVVNSNNDVTGEIANWDITHPMGLVAPREDLAWEISGDDSFSFEME